jgi:hypothetical protein
MWMIRDLSRWLHRQTADERYMQFYSAICTPSLSNIARYRGGKTSLYRGVIKAISEEFGSAYSANLTLIGPACGLKQSTP